MTWISALFIALLVLVILYPLLEPRVTRERRSRSAHRGDVVHWYPNYDEDLRFEPRHEHDIVAISRRDLEGFGYRAGTETAVVPRTFRGRVPGDQKLRLWTSSDDLRPVWVCCWNQAIELPSVTGSTVTTMPLTREILARIQSGPVRTLDDGHIPADSSKAEPITGWHTGATEETPEVTELVPETNRFYCAETTPLSHILPVATFSQPTEDEEPVEVDRPAIRIPAKTKRSPRSRGRKPKRSRKRR